MPFLRLSDEEKKRDAAKVAAAKSTPFVTRYSTYCRTDQFDSEFLGRAYMEAYQSPSSPDKWCVNLVVEEERGGETYIEYSPVGEASNVSFYEAMEKMAVFVEQSHGRDVIAQAPEAQDFVFVYEQEGLLTDAQGMPVMPMNEHTLSEGRAFRKADLERAANRHMMARHPNRDVNPTPSLFNEVFKKAGRKGNFDEVIEAMDRLKELDDIFSALTELHEVYSTGQFSRYSKSHSRVKNSSYKAVRNGYIIKPENMSRVDENFSIDWNDFTLNTTDAFSFQLYEANKALEAAKGLDKETKNSLHDLMLFVCLENIALSARDIMKSATRDALSVRHKKELKILDGYMDAILKNGLKVKNIDSAKARIKSFIMSDVPSRRDAAQSFSGRIISEYNSWRKEVGKDNAELARTPPQFSIPDINI